MPDPPGKATRVPCLLDGRCTTTHLAPLRDDREAAVHWQALLDAGLIGAMRPASPEVLAQRATNDALFRRIAADRRAARQARSA